MTETSIGRDHVVVGVDGSEHSRHALQWARFLAGTLDASILAVAAWQPLTVHGAMGTGWAAPLPDFDPDVAAWSALEQTLDDVFGAERPAGLEVSVAEGNPAKVLLESSRGARMLVVGSRGYGGFTGLLLGAVSSACARHATCPVLVAHGTTPPPGPGPS